MTYTNEEAFRIIRKWLNEEILCDIDRQALATILGHYSELIDKYELDSYYGSSGFCPECSSKLKSPKGGGVVCSNRECDYWFCF